MEYTGVLFRFKLNRHLAAEERSNQLPIDRRAHMKPYDELSLTRMNSTFVEIVDRQFRYKGFMAMIAGTLLFVVAWALLSTAGAVVLTWESIEESNRVEAGIAAAAIIAMGLPFLAFCAWLVLRESFSYTHYPIRLNRKTRRVYVWRPPEKGGILTADWDQVFWHLGESLSRGIGGRCWDVRGHVLDAQGLVKETFVVGHFDYDREFVKHQWEFYRRYMQDGPQSLPPVQAFLHVHDRRESLIESVGRCWYLAGDGVLMALMLPLTTLMGLARWAAMHTSRLPTWPAEIEAACAIEPCDPYWLEPGDDGVPRKMAR